MAQIRSKNTALERRLGELLEALFPHYTLISHPADLPGKPDWWIPELRIAVFADGCFFHMCPQHCVIPVNNREYWEPKLRRNRRRDLATNKALRAIGGLPVRIWEHSIEKDTAGVRRKLLRALRKQLEETRNESQ